MTLNTKTESATPRAKQHRRRLAAKATLAEAVADISLKDDVLLGTTEAAALVGLSPKSLRAMRCARTGPRCLKLGATKQSRTVYRRSDLERWVRSCVVAVTGS